MIKNTLTSIAILTGIAATTIPVDAASLDSLESLSGLASGDVTGALMSAGLSELGLTAKQIQQATPILEQSITKGKEIMQSYNFDPNAENDISAEDLTKMKGELGEEITSSKSMLGDFISADTLDSVMSLVKSQLPGGLL
jgi:ABC-type proline/glycine betaine transport system substrate-binding protein